LFNSKFKFNLLHLQRFNYLASQLLFKMSSCGSNAGLETPAPLANDIVNNALFHTSIRRYIKPFSSCTVVCRLVAKFCLIFCSQLDWGRAVRQPQI